MYSMLNLSNQTCKLASAFILNKSTNITFCKVKQKLINLASPHLKNDSQYNVIKVGYKNNCMHTHTHKVYKIDIYL